MKKIFIFMSVSLWLSSLAQTYHATATAYTSSVAETDNSPFVTATGTRARLGVVALSRDMLKRIPYGSIVRIYVIGKQSGAELVNGGLFYVEDTMNRRWTNKIDVWLPNTRQAMEFGRRQVRIKVVRLSKSWR